MTITPTVLVILIATAVLAATTWIVVRRRPAPETVTPDELRALQTDIGRLMGRIDSGFEMTARDASTVRSAIDLLTHDSGRRGTWGEVTLRRLLERAGMAHGVDFDTQVALPGGRPDALVHLGAGGTIVIDAKAPLDDLRRAYESDREDERAQFLSSHAAAVRRHVRELAGREYPARLRATFAPVIMYLPVDAAWEAAVEAMPDLTAEALALGVHPASPRTLGLVLEVLKHHALTVNQEAATRDILEDARELIGRLETHAGHLKKMGNALASTVEAYNKAVGNAATRLLPSTSRIAAHLGRRALEAPEGVGALPQTERVPEFTEHRVA